MYSLLSVRQQNKYKMAATDLHVGEREGRDGASEASNKDRSPRLDDHVCACANGDSTGQSRALDVSLSRESSV